VTFFRLPVVSGLAGSLHGRFPISNREEAMAEALMKERANLENDAASVDANG
jgi:hypothetical protein